MLYKRGDLKNFSKFIDKHKRQSSGGVLLKEKMFSKILQISQKHLCRSLLFNVVADWKPEILRSSHWRCSVKQGALKNFVNFKGNKLCWSLFLIKLQFLRPATLLKKTPTQVLPCEICNYFEEHL